MRLQSLYHWRLRLHHRLPLAQIWLPQRARPPRPGARPPLGITCQLVGYLACAAAPIAGGWSSMRSPIPLIGSASESLPVDSWAGGFLHC